MLGFGFWRLDWHGSACWVWIGGLGSVDGGFGLVDRWVWINGFVDRWVDRLGWSSVAPMVAPIVIFLCMGLLLVLVWSFGFCLGLIIWFWFDGGGVALGLWLWWLFFLNGFNHLVLVWSFVFGLGLIVWFWFDGGGIALGWWILILAEFCYGFCSVEVGGVTEKLDSGGGGGGGWLREKEK